MKKFLLFVSFFITVACFGQAPNTWVRKADFGGAARYGPVSFSIGTKGYIGTGTTSNTNSGFKKDFWEWDQSTNTWTQKADFAGTARLEAVGFSIGTKGYIGTGTDANSQDRNDFWEWDQATNIWTPMANFSGAGRGGACGFSIGSKGYIGTGNTLATYFKDFWEWDQSTNTWTKKADFPSTGRYQDVGFSIGTKGYIGTGSIYNNGYTYYGDFWEWDQILNVWTQKANFVGSARQGAVGFSIGTKGYIGSGGDNGFKNDLWEWDQATNTWIQKAAFGGSARYFSTGFSMGAKGYLGTGVAFGSTFYNDFWEYTPGSISTDSIPSPICAGSNINILFNSTDTFNSGNVFTAQLSNSSGSFSAPTVIGSIAATVAGVINVTIPANTPFGTAYRIRVVSSNTVVIGSDNGSNITIILGDTLNLKFFTQGYYQTGGIMRKVLHNEAVDTSSNSTLVDTVIVELHNATSPYATFASCQGVLQTNGTVVCNYCSVVGNSYYIAVKHRNTVQTWSAAPVLMSTNTSYDFTTANAKAYGNNMIQIEPGRWAFYCGDINQDENVDLNDFPLWQYGSVYGLFGYYASDLNGDGNVDLLDFSFLNTNINAGVYSSHP